MPIMLEKLYDALRAGNVPDDKARAASVEVAEFKERLNAIETRLAVLMVMVGGLYAVAAPAIWLLARVAFKVGAL